MPGGFRVQSQTKTEPDKDLVFFRSRVLFLSRRQSDGTCRRLVFHGGWLLTHPDEDFSGAGLNNRALNDSATSVSTPSGGGDVHGGVQVSGGPKKMGGVIHSYVHGSMWVGELLATSLETS